jgi:hypothetical protein
MPAGSLAYLHTSALDELEQDSKLARGALMSSF